MITKKDHKVLASAMHDAHKHPASDDMRPGIEYCCQFIIAALRRNNPNFDEGKFREVLCFDGNLYRG